MSSTLSEANEEYDIYRAYNENSCCTFSNQKPTEEFIRGYKKGYVKSMEEDLKRCSRQNVEKRSNHGRK